MAASDLLFVNQRPSRNRYVAPVEATSRFPAGRPILAPASADSETAREIEVGSRGGEGCPA